MDPLPPAPSVLDSPRFFDEEPLSAWSVDGGVPSKAADLSKASGKLLWRNEEDEWPKPPHPADPISVECVRDESGWRIVVDGICCEPKSGLSDQEQARFYELREKTKSTTALTPSEQSELDYFRYESQNRPQRVTLPPGLDVSKPLSSSSVLRSLVVGVRLEQDAMAPLEVNMEVVQILNSAEMASLPSGQSLERRTDLLPLKAYRVNDETATMVTCPYPLVIPNQSSLGVVDFKPVNSWLSKQHSTISTNAYRATEHAFQVGQYNQQLAVYEGVQDLNAVLNFADAFVPGGNTVRDVIGSMTRGVSQPTLPIRKKNKEFALVPDQSGQIVIGGTESAPKELASILTTLTKLCSESLGILEHVEQRLQDSDDNSEFRTLYLAGKTEQKPNEPNKFQIKDTVEFRLGVMRQLLHVRESNKAAVLFDTLLSCQVAPPHTTAIQALTAQFYELSPEDQATKTLDDGKGTPFRAIARKYKTDSSGSKRISGMDQVERDKYIQDLKKLSNEENNEQPDDSRPYVFTFNRMQYSELIRTNIQVVLRLRIRDFNGEEIVFEVCASQINGAAAHAIASGLIDDVEQFERVSEAFVDCYDEFNRDSASMTRRIGSKLFTGASTLGRYAKFLIPNGVVKRELLGWANAGYYWLCAGGKYSDRNPLKMSLPELEDRIIGLRMECRSVLPPWPPPKEKKRFELKELPDSTNFSQKLDNLMTEVKAALPSPPNKPKTPTELRAKLYNDQVKESMFAGALSELDQSRVLKDFREATENDIELINRIKSEVEKRKSSNPNNFLSEELDPSLVTDANDLIAKFKDLGYIKTLDRVERVYYQTMAKDPKVAQRKLPQIVATVPMTFRFLPPSNPDPPEFMDVDASEVTPLFELIAKRAQDTDVNQRLPLAQTVVAGTTALGVSSLISANSVAIMAYFTAVGVALANIFAAVATLGIIVAVALPNAAAPAGLLVWLRMAKPTANSPVAPSVLNIATMVSSACLSWIKTWFLGDATRREIWIRAAKDVRGNPVLQTFASATASIREYERKLLKKRKSVGLREEVVIRACYNTETGRRFQVTELYMNDTDLKLSLRDAAPVHYGQWWSVPIASALTLLPPSQVSDKIFEVTQLRSIPTARQFALLGARDAQALPSDLAARAAVLEIFQAVKRHRRDLKGEHLLSTAAQTTQSLVNDATRIIMAAYGPKSGTTLVDGDDPIWSCLAGGIVARLSLRHYDLFVQAQIALKASAPESSVAVAAEFWNGPRRRMMEAFCMALEHQVKEMARVTSSFSGASLKEVCYEASGSFYRVLSLASANIAPEAALVVASSVAHSLEFANEDAWAEVKRIIEEAVDDASTFKDQTNYDQPTQTVNGSILAASWASRRLAPDVVRELAVIGTPQNLNFIIKDLAALSVDDNSKTTSYLAPYGGRLASLPSNVVDPRGLSTRVVWLSAVADACSRLEKAVTPPYIWEGDPVRIVLSEFRTFESDASFSGIARHPLALTKDPKGNVHVRLASVAERTPDQLDPVENLAEAVERLRSLQDQEVVQQRVHLLRCLAFNSDRIVQACGLAAAAAGRSRYIEIEMAPDSRRAHFTALAVGMAMHTTETGTLIARIRLVDQDGQDLDAGVGWLLAAAQNAINSGCKVVSLGEAALALSGFGAP